MWFRITIVVFAALTLACSVVEACTMGRGLEELRVKFDRELYVLVGEVIGETEEVESGNVIGKVKGVKVKPVDIIYAPLPTIDYYEFFKFGVTSWCADTGRRRNFPPGTRLRIIAKEADLIPNRSRDGHIRLQSRMLERTSIDDPTSSFSSSISAIYDYSKTLPPFLLNPKTFEDSLLRSAFSDFYHVEVSKDLLRLESAKSEIERLAVLERLLYCPTVDFHRLIDPALGERGFGIGTKKLSEIEKRLIKERDKLEALGLQRRALGLR